MRKHISLLCVSSFVLSLNSCAWLPGSDPGQEPPSPRVKVTPKPLVQSSPGENSAPATSALTPSTDPIQRQQEAKKGRLNPFAILPAEPLVTLKSTEEGAKNETKGKLSATGANGDPCLPSSNAKGDQSPNVTYIEVPSPPVPNEARGVLVTGVLNIGSSPVAIVKAPNESVARQVTPGTVLSKGLVRVKAINDRSEVPNVVLEQYGTEVVRSVGQAPASPLPQPPPKRIPIVNKQAPVKTTNASSPLCPPNKAIKG